MCKDCGKRKRSYKWIRDREGNPRRTPNGSYVMMDEMGACFGFSPETIDQVIALLEEIRDK